MQAGYERQAPVAAVAEFERFESDIPAAMVLIQAAEQKVHQTMEFMIGMPLQLTIWTPTLMDCASLHVAPRFPSSTVRLALKWL